MDTKVEGQGLVDKLFCRKSRSPETSERNKKTIDEIVAGVKSEIERLTKSCNQNVNVNEVDKSDGEKTNVPKESPKNEKVPEKNAKVEEKPKDSVSCRMFITKDEVSQVKLTEIINNSIKEAVLNIVKEGVCPLAEDLESRRRELDKKIPKNDWEESHNKENKRKCPKNHSSFQSSSNNTFDSHLCRNQFRALTQCEPVPVPRSPRKTCCEINPCETKEKKAKSTKQRDGKTKDSSPPKIVRQPKNSGFRTDNRRMTGNVNIYICSEANERTNDSQAKPNDEVPSAEESETDSQTKTNDSNLSISTSKLVAALKRRKLKNVSDQSLDSICETLGSSNGAQCCDIVDDDHENDLLCMCDENDEFDSVDFRTPARNGCIDDSDKFRELDFPNSINGPYPEWESCPYTHYDGDQCWTSTRDEHPIYERSKVDLDENCFCFSPKRCEADQKSRISDQEHRNIRSGRSYHRESGDNRCLCIIEEKEEECCTDKQGPEEKITVYGNQPTNDKRISQADQKRPEKRSSSSASGPLKPGAVDEEMAKMKVKEQLNGRKPSEDRSSKNSVGASIFSLPKAGGGSEQSTENRVNEQLNDRKPSKDRSSKNSVGASVFGLSKSEEVGSQIPKNSVDQQLNGRKSSKDRSSKNSVGASVFGLSKSEEVGSQITKNSVDQQLNGRKSLKDRSSKNSVGASVSGLSKSGQVSEQITNNSVDQQLNGRKSSKDRSSKNSVGASVFGLSKSGEVSEQITKNRVAEQLNDEKPSTEKGLKNSVGASVSGSSKSGEVSEQITKNSVDQQLNGRKSSTGRRSKNSVGDLAANSTEKNQADEVLKNTSHESATADNNSQGVSSVVLEKNQRTSFFRRSINRAMTMMTNLTTRNSNEAGEQKTELLPAEEPEPNGNGNEATSVAEEKNTSSSAIVPPPLVLSGTVTIPRNDSNESRSKSRISMALAKRKISATKKNSSKNVPPEEDPTKENEDQCPCEESEGSRDCRCKKMKPQANSSVDDNNGTQNQSEANDPKTCKSCPGCKNTSAECNCRFNQQNEIEEDFCERCRSLQHKSREFRTSNSASSRKYSESAGSQEHLKNQGYQDSNGKWPKPMICIYCDNPRESCICTAPIRKGSQYRMPFDVCTCNSPQCRDFNGRQIFAAEDNENRTFSVTAWKPRQKVARYFSRSPETVDGVSHENCSCWENAKPYGSGALPYQKTGVFSDVINELQQKISGSVYCEVCKKVQCRCHCRAENVPEKITMTPELSTIPEHGNRSRRTSRSQSPLESICKCAPTPRRRTKKSGICDKCQTSPCRCRQARESPENKPPAQCYFCKSSPCICESVHKTGNSRPLWNDDSSNRRRKDRSGERKIDGKIDNKDNEYRAPETNRFVPCPGKQQRNRKYCYRASPNASRRKPSYPGERVR